MKALLSLLLISAMACTPTQTFSMGQLVPVPPAPLVAQRSPRTAYIVLDPAKVPERVEIQVLGQHVPDDSGGPRYLEDAPAFVARDLRQALGLYFSSVRVISPGQPIGPGPAVVVDVSLDHVNTEVATWSHGAMTFDFKLTWSIAMRLAESKAYLFSFSGESTSSEVAEGSSGLRSVFEHALTDVVQANLNKQDIQDRLQLPPAPAVSVAGGS